MYKKFILFDSEYWQAKLHEVEIKHEALLRANIAASNISSVLSKIFDLPGLANSPGIKEINIHEIVENTDSQRNIHPYKVKRVAHFGKTETVSKRYNHQAGKEDWGPISAEDELATTFLKQNDDKYKETKALPVNEHGEKTIKTAFGRIITSIIFEKSLDDNTLASFMSRYLDKAEEIIRMDLFEKISKSFSTFLYTKENSNDHMEFLLKELAKFVYTNFAIKSIYLHIENDKQPELSFDIKVSTGYDIKAEAPELRIEKNYVPEFTKGPLLNTEHYLGPNITANITYEAESNIAFEKQKGFKVLNSAITNALSIAYNKEIAQYNSEKNKFFNNFLKDLNNLNITLNDVDILQLPKTLEAFIKNKLKFSQVTIHTEMNKPAPPNTTAYPLLSPANQPQGYIYLDTNEANQKEYLLELVLLVSTLAGSFLASKIENSRDFMTNLYNRNFLTRWVANYFSTQIINTENVSTMFMIDLDYFKEVNDIYGHTAADMLLRKWADILCAASPENALEFRFGGDEIIVALPGIDETAAKVHVKKMFEHLTTTPVDIQCLTTKNDFAEKKDTAVDLLDILTKLCFAVTRKRFGEEAIMFKDQFFKRFYAKKILKEAQKEIIDSFKEISFADLNLLTEKLGLACAGLIEQMEELANIVIEENSQTKEFTPLDLREHIIETMRSEEIQLNQYIEKAVYKLTEKGIVKDGLLVKAITIFFNGLLNKHSFQKIRQELEIHLGHFYTLRLCGSLSGGYADTFGLTKPDAWHKKVDQRVYEAKANGRGRVFGPNGVIAIKVPPEKP